MCKPFIIVVTGRPGSGKTTLAHKLAQRIHCPTLSRDEFKEGYVHTMGGNHESLGKDVNGKIYEIFFQTVGHIITNGISVVIEAAFQHKLWQPKLNELSKHADIAIVVCAVDPHLAQKRFIERGLANSARERFHGDKIYTAKGNQYNPIGTYNPPQMNFPTLIVDCNDGYDPSLESIAEFALAAKPSKKKNLNSLSEI